VEIFLDTLSFIVIALVILAGLTSGFLVNYIADVLPIKRRLSKPLCLSCGHEYGWIDYINWYRPCPSCGIHHSLRTWLVYFLFVGLSLWLWLRPQSNFNYIIGLLLLVYFGVVTVIDLEYRLILHPTSIFGAIFGFLIGVDLHGIKSTILGGLVGFGVMFFIYYFGRLFMRWVARRRGDITDDEAIGFGDVNLSGIVGLMLGWPGIIAGLFLTIIIAGVVSLVYLVLKLVTRRYQAFMAIPYGPFLVASTIILLYFIDTLRAVAN
jgi:leader peptidase (prepilin peptidase)/N-methyltransferase